MHYFNPVLLADDDDDDCDFFIQAARVIEPNIQVIRFTDGTHLLEKIDQVDNPKILFLDLNMPKVNGYQCLLQLRADSRYQKLLIVIFSTSGSTEMISKLKDAGADDFVVKPNDFKLWKETISKVIVSKEKIVN